MHSIARATIIFPLIIIFAAVIMRISGTSYQSEKVSTVPLSISPSKPSPINTSPFKPAENQASAIKLNLKGPLVCSHTDIDKDMKVFIENKRIYAKFAGKESTSYFLINGDCLYKWSEGEKAGIKMCNVGQYLSLIESFSNIPFFSPESLLSFLPQVQGTAQSGINQADASLVMKSCEEKVIDNTLFEIPRTIQFVEQKISGIPEGLSQ